jgi:hypothetical protein
MTNQSSKLNKDDIKYLLGILQDEEVRGGKSQSRKTHTY